MIRKTKKIEFEAAGMHRESELVVVDAAEAREVVGGLLIPNFLDALQRCMWDSRQPVEVATL